MASDLNLFESDHKSQEDGQSLASGSTTPSGRKSKNFLRSNLHMSGLSSENEEVNDEGSHHS